MKKDFDIEYVTFERDGLEDFRNVILPDIYGDLFVTDDFGDRAVLAVGALSEGTPVAAVIAQLLEDGTADVKSVYVDEDYRRAGIGTELIKGILSLSRDLLAQTVDIENANLEVCVRVQYVFPKNDLDDFEAWLKKVGFSDFADYPDIYMFEDRLPEVNVKQPEAVHPLSDIPDVAEDEMVNLLREMGIAPVPQYSFYSGDVAEPDIMLLAESSDMESFRLLSVAADESGSENQYLSLAAKVFDEVRKTQPDAVVFVDSGKNLYPDLWKKLAKKSGVLKRREAGLYVRFV